MTEGKKQITEFFTDTGKPYFALFYKGKVESGNAIKRNDKDEAEYDFKSGLESFERVLSILGYGEYVLVLNDTKDVTKRGRIDMGFKIPINEGSENANNNQQQISGVSTGITMEQAEKIADDRFAKLISEKENKDLKEKLAEVEKENKELQGKVSKPWTDAIGALAPHFPTIINSWIGAPAVPQLQISGAIPSSTGLGDEVEQQQIFQNFVVALSTARPNDWLEIIQKLTVLAADSNKLEMALKFI